MLKIFALTAIIVMAVNPRASAQQYSARRNGGIVELEDTRSKADGKSAWVTSRLDVFKQPMAMKQWPFAHTIEMTHRLQDGVLQIQTTLHNMSAEPMPATIGFHPYY